MTTCKLLPMTGILNWSHYSFQNIHLRLDAVKAAAALSLGKQAGNLCEVLNTD